jgi:hypothetical protein
VYFIGLSLSTLIMCRSGRGKFLWRNSEDNIFHVRKVNVMLGICHQCNSDSLKFTQTHNWLPLGPGVE